MPCVDTSNCTAKSTINHTLFLEKYIKSVKFTGASNESVLFDVNGDITSGAYNIYSVASIKTRKKFKKIGQWSLQTKKVIMLNQSKQINGEVISSQCSSICMPGYYPIIHLDNHCCWKCIPCPEVYYKVRKGQHKCTKCTDYGISDYSRTKCAVSENNFSEVKSRMAIGIYILASIGVVLSSIVIHSFIKYRKTPMVLSSNITLSFIQLIAHLLLYIHIAIYVFKDTRDICTAKSFMLGTLLVIIISVTTVKTRILVKVFNHKHRTSKSKVMKTKSFGFLTITLATIFIILLNVLLHQVKPITITSYINKSSFTVEDRCNITLHYLLQAIYILVLQFSTGVQAFRARKLPENVNEAKYISFTMFSSALVIILAMPILGSTTTKESSHFAVSVMVFVINSLFLGILYGYKLRIMWFHPEINNKTAFKREIFGSAHSLLLSDSVNSSYILGTRASRDNNKNRVQYC